MIAEGRNINVTLIFSLDRYAEVIEAYLAGLETYAADAGADLSRVASVGQLLRQPGRHRGRPPARGDRHRPRRSRCAARRRSPRPSSPTSSSARRSAVRAGRRWPPGAPACSGRCGPPRRTKNPAYPDTLYVDAADRARHGQHAARRHDRGVRRPRHAGPHRRRRRRRGRGRCGRRWPTSASTWTTSRARSSARASTPSARASTS